MRPLHHRLKEHADSIDACLKKTKLKEEDNSSALAHHIFENPSHSIKFDQVQLIAIVPQLLKQKIREALEIAKNKPAIIKDNGEFHISEIWEPVTQKLKTHKKNLLGQQPSMPLPKFGPWHNNNSKFGSSLVLFSVFSFIYLVILLSGKKFEFNLMMIGTGPFEIIVRKINHLPSIAEVSLLTSLL